jgi:hypothetical protein
MPSADTLRALAAEIQEVALMLNGARQEGFLREALTEQMPIDSRDSG